MSESYNHTPSIAEKFAFKDEKGETKIDWEAVEKWGRTAYPAELGGQALEATGLVGSAETTKKLSLIERARLLDIVAGAEQPQLTKEMFDREDGALVPNLELAIDDKKFLFTKPFESGDYTHMVAYAVGDDQIMKPRLFYRSHSDGGWRATLGISRKHNGFSYIKSPDGSDGRYVQDTKLDDRVLSAIEQQESAYAHHRKEVSTDNLVGYFDYLRLGDEGVDSFESEVAIDKFDNDPQLERLYDTYEVGVGFKVAPHEARQTLRSPDLLPAGFTPDFDGGPMSVKTQQHTMAGEISVSTYAANYKDKSYTWHVAEDLEGNVWLDKITKAGGQVSSYGTASEVIVTGALSAKPFEYRRNTRDMDAGEDFDRLADSDYVDLRQKLWGNMHWVKQYKQAKNTA